MREREVDADAVVFKWHPPLPAAKRIVAAVNEVARGHALPAATVAVDVGLDEAELYAYLLLRTRAAIAAPDALVRALERVSGIAGVRAARLARLQDVPGASDGAAARFQYVVETDVRTSAERDMNDWYDREHLPGLAAVPGTVRARRFVNLDGTPRYHSCYELVTAETQRSAAWVAVRNSAWSERVRPAFHNTKRTMFRRIAEDRV